MIGRLHGMVILAGLILATLAFAAPSALANRTYESSIEKTGEAFESVNSIAFDAEDDAWVTDGSYGEQEDAGLYKYAHFPSHTLLKQPNTQIIFGNRVLQPAVDFETGEVFVANSNQRAIDIFGAKSGVFSREWSHLNGIAPCFGCSTQVRVAVDNSGTTSNGRVYLSLESPEDAVEAFDSAQRPVDFPATASYVEGNKLTGTPSGSFGAAGPDAVGPAGEIFVIDSLNFVVDEFDSTGTFVREIPDPRAEIFNWGPGVGVDPTNGNLLITEYGSGVSEWDPFGNYLGSITEHGGEYFQAEGTPGIDSHGHLYVAASNRVETFSPATAAPRVLSRPASSLTSTSAAANAEIDPNSGGDVAECAFEYGTSQAYGSTAGCTPDPGGSPFSAPTAVSAALTGLTPETTYHYRFVAHNANAVGYGEDQTYTPHELAGLTTEAASNITERAASLNGSVIGNGEAIEYKFEWGPTSEYGNSTPLTAAGSPSGPASRPLTAGITGLTPYSTYHYRVVASTGAGTTHGEDLYFTTPPGAPTVPSQSSSEIHSDRAVLHAGIDPNGAPTEFHFEYVDQAHFETGEWADATHTPNMPIGRSKEIRNPTSLVSSLEPGTLYHYRAVATNAAGTGTPTHDYTFTTFPFVASEVDPCPNNHVRQQTGSSKLLDCRAYELASAADADGYDVESDLVEGETPYAGYPDAENPSRLLYGVHGGGIAGTGYPTNRGVDPYVATRDPETGWRTTYVGIPGNDPFSAGPFSSTLAEANADLTTFAFGGPEICSPCFADGSAGEPVHLPGGELVQGLAGSLHPGAMAEPAGHVGRALSADGTNLVFGSTSKFEEDGNSDGDITIYERDLQTGITHVVSKTPAGQTMTGPGIGELDVSGNGSRVLVGQLLGEGAGAKRWHLYMNVGESDHSVDLTPGTTAGALYDGMTADGSKVFFTTADKLLPGEDTDNSADLYEADVSGAGTATLHLISTGSGGSGNSDSCDPAADTIDPHWNTTGAAEDCGVVAIGGRGGVASADGTVYFFSPELLDGPGNGVEGAPNLYVVRPGSAPAYVASLESNANATLPEPVHPLERTFGTFAKPSGIAFAPNGDTYVLDVTPDVGSGFVEKFGPDGNLIAGYGENGKFNGETSGSEAFAEYGARGLPTTIAVDDQGDLYVPSFLGGVVDKFSPSGEILAQLEVPLPSGVAIDHTTGKVYVTSWSGSEINVFDEVTGAFLSSFESIERPTGIAVDSTTGTIYVVNGGGPQQVDGEVVTYKPSGEFDEVFSAKPSLAVAVDPSNGHVYVDEGKKSIEADNGHEFPDQGKQVTEFNSEGERAGQTIGVGIISESFGLAAEDDAVYISNGTSGKVDVFGRSTLPPDTETDSPLVIDSVNSPEERRTADFQVTPNGDYGAFSTTLSLTGYDNGGHSEVFRYDSPAQGVECASCNQTSEQATGEAGLPGNGSGLTDDGRVFFNTTEGLVDRDLNERRDAYEWEAQGSGPAPATCEAADGCVDLVSTGISQYPSSLLGVSDDGIDAYFFTRDKLAEQDENGNSVKIYDARQFGGFPFTPQKVQCKASDECHGPSSNAPGPPEIRTFAPTNLGRTASANGRGSCRVGQVKKRGKCRHRKHRHNHHKVRARRQGGGK